MPRDEPGRQRGTLKHHPSVPRIEPAARTLQRLRPVARRIPVTRIADLTPLAGDGLPVFCAVTPLAADLTTHLGKGTDAAAAEASALMEAVERHAAEAPAGQRCRAAFDALAAGPVAVDDPRGHALPADTAFDPGRPCDWLMARDLDGTPVWIAADLVRCPPCEGLLHQPDTNGLAAGNCWHEAVVHALCELIERDALSLALYAELFADPGERATPAALDPETLPPGPAALRAALERDGRRVILHDLTSEIAVPVLRASLIDPAYPGPVGPELRVFLGLGCDPDPELAAARALTEAAQARTATLQGARDSFNDRPDGGAEARRALLAALAVPAGPGRPLRPFAALPRFLSPDLAEDLGHLRARLAAAGFGSVRVADITHPEIGETVVRVRVPGLAVFAVDRSRIGLRCLQSLA